jgi:DNA-directed RNA polymerase subunit RPC12/RpoP
MNFCTKCGNKFEKENIFCSKCGLKLDVKNESILGLKTAKETSAKPSKNKDKSVDRNQKINGDGTDESLEDSIQKPNKNIFKYILKKINSHKIEKKRKNVKKFLVFIFILVSLFFSFYSIL